MVDEQILREKLKALRDYYGMSTKTMAERVGMRPKWLQNYFRGERGLAGDELVNIMLVFGIGPAFFICVSSSRFFVNHHPILSGLSTKDLRISPRAAGPTLPSCFPA